MFEESGLGKMLFLFSVEELGRKLFTLQHDDHHHDYHNYMVMIMMMIMVLKNWGVSCLPSSMPQLLSVYIASEVH